MENTKKRTFWSIAVIGVKLLLICAIVAGIVSFVYDLTLEKYEDNIKETKNKAIGQIFGKDGLACDEVAEGVYTVKENDILIGYCVEATGKGFGGDIQLMVGYTVDQKIVAVEIIGHSETPGVGDKVKNSDYLAGYSDKVGELTLGTDVDKIAGASVSSRGVMAGVNAATKMLQAYLAQGGAAS